jgi:hypothetical protein
MEEIRKFGQGVGQKLGSSFTKTLEIECHPKM